MRIQGFTFLILLSSFCFGQSKLAGFVREQNTGAKVAGAIIKSFGANSIASNTSGSFILTFQDAKPGKNIDVRAEMDGWEVVNEKEMSTLIPENPNERPFKIILCKASTLATAKKNYHNIFEQNLEKELSKHKAINKGNQEKIASLEQHFGRLQKQLKELADEYSRIDLSDASAKELKAIELFKEGKYDEFIELKKSIVTDAEAVKAIESNKDLAKKKANNDSTIEVYSKSRKDIANALIVQFKFEEAEKTFENLVSKDTTDYDNAFDFARFLQQQNKHDKAIQYYLSALKSTKGEVEIAMTQNNLGSLYQDRNDFPAALNAYGKALEIYERLAKTNPAAYEPGVATIQNNLGLLNQLNNDYPVALNAYEKSLEISERLAKSSPATYEPDVAMTQNNLGGLNQAKNDFPAALKAYEKALEIYDRLAKTDAVTYEPYIATIQNNLGLLYQTKNDYPAALNAYEKAFEIRKRLTKTNPATYEPYLAGSQQSLGLLYQAKNDFPAALNAYEKSLEIYKRLAKTNPATYEQYVAMTQANLGGLFQVTNDYPSALNAYEKALEIYERLANTNPATYEPDVAMTQNNLGLLYTAKNDYTAALNAYEKALEIYGRFAKANPATYEPNVAMTQNNLGLLYYAKKDYLAALNAYNKALEIRERFAKTNPATFEPLVATTQNNLGISYYFNNDYPASLNALSKAFAINELLAKTHPDLYEIEFCRTIVLLGLLQKEVYQENRQMLIQQYLVRAKQILPRYTDIPLGKELLENVNNLETYFQSKK